MNLIQRVCEILDFPPQFASLAIQEACSKEKLQGTWMRVNGEVRYVYKFLFDTNEITDDNGNKETVTSLDVFLPESGLYAKDDSCCFVKKSPVKQWCKSFSTKNYSYTFIQTGNLDKNFYKFLGEAIKVPFFLTDSGNIYHNREKVATFKEDICTVTNPLFHQELIDWVTKENLPWKVQ